MKKNDWQFSLEFDGPSFAISNERLVVNYSVSKQTPKDKVETSSARLLP
jgi:hypothetical protein